MPLLPLLALASAALAQPPIHGLPRTDRNSAAAHQQLLQKARAGRIHLYFTGDSITRRWGATDPQYAHFLANWNQNFHGWNAANFGWGADTIHNTLWRLENGEIDNVHPKAIVLLAGTNNIGGAPPPDQHEAKFQEVTAAIRATLALLQNKAPNAVIILMGILPRNDRGTAIVPLINRINANIAQLADGKRVRYCNINAQLAAPDGTLHDGVTVDKLHLSLKGYQIWADALDPLLQEILGPRATTDTAPPPTGDPGIKG